MGDKVLEMIRVVKRDMFPIADVLIQSDYTEKIVERMLLKLAIRFIDLAEDFDGKVFDGEPIEEVTRVFGIRFGIIFPNDEKRNDYVEDIRKIFNPPSL